MHGFQPHLNTFYVPGAQPDARLARLLLLTVMQRQPCIVILQARCNRQLCARHLPAHS
jgi:hypothetical protein